MDTVTEKKAILRDLGVMGYRNAYDLQLDLVEMRRLGEIDTDIFLIAEHPSVLTLGRRGGRENLMVSEEFLQQNGVMIIHVERGGDITYHGIGQLVVYPIIDLKTAGLSVTEYIFRLEEVMIRLAADFGLAVTRDPRNHGVWVGNRKIGSVGIAIRHGITFHGLALNINNSIEPFQWIRPCGLPDVQMTSLAAELFNEMPMEEVKENLANHLALVFRKTLSKADATMMLLN
jgi:lipoyl(octanoyl) transferase